MDYLPIFCQLKGRACLIVGGGIIAERKARLLINAGAIVTINAPHITDVFQHWHQQRQIQLILKEYQSHLLLQQWLVIAATDDAELNQQIARDCEHYHCFCNIVDTPESSSFIMPAIIDRSPVIIAISSGGHAPVLIRLLREKLEALLPQYLGKLAYYAGTLRHRVKAQFHTLKQRRLFWEKFFKHERLAQALYCKQPQQVLQLTEQLFQQPIRHQGEVILVGAGPGDAGLLTLKGLQQIQQADVVVYDRLVSAEVMTLVRREAEQIFVGKSAGNHSKPQAEINQLLLTLAQQGKRVVRLKGGDPTIFGRSSEELLILAKANIPFSIVPGITAASGCSAYSGIPLTHRDYANSVHLVTAHRQAEQELDWSILSHGKQTLVFYMGLNQAPRIEQQLLRYGMAADTAIAIIQDGTLLTQRVWQGKLAELSQLAAQAKSPSLLIIGEVVGLRQQLYQIAR